MTDKEKKRAKKMITKVEIEKILCECFNTLIDTDIKGYDVIANLMCMDTHDANKYIYKVLSGFESEFSVKRPENWNDFSNRVSKAIWAEGNEDRKNLSAKTKGLRNAVYTLAVMADCFEYIEKSEFELKED